MEGHSSDMAGKQFLEDRDNYCLLMNQSYINGKNIAPEHY